MVLLFAGIKVETLCEVCASVLVLGSILDFSSTRMSLSPLLVLYV